MDLKATRKTTRPKLSDRVKESKWVKKIKNLDWWGWLNKAKTLLEILAILIAGWWAYTRFIQGEAPSLATRGDIQGNLTWSSHSKDTCQGDFEVEFKNIGKTPIIISKVRLSAWSFDEPVGSANDRVRFIEPLKIQRERLFEQEANDYMAFRYGPDERVKHGFGFIVNRTPGKRILFMADVWGHEEGGEQGPDPTWIQYNWDWFCGENPSPSPTPTPAPQDTAN